MIGVSSVSMLLCPGSRGFASVLLFQVKTVCVGITHELAARSGPAYRARYNRDEMKAHEACVNRNRLEASSGGSLGLPKTPRVP